jgi:hypothetical protein
MSITRHVFALLTIALCLSFCRHSTADNIADFANGNYTVSAWIKTRHDGPIFAGTRPSGVWVRGGKTGFVSNGRLAFDIGWSGVVQGRKLVADGKWHHVAFAGASPQKLYVDGKLDREGRLETLPDPTGIAFKIGITSDNFPLGGKGFTGEIDDVRVYGRALSESEIAALAKAESVADGLVAHWPLDGKTDASVGKHKAIFPGKIAFAAGRVGKSLRLSAPKRVARKPSSPPADLVEPGELNATQVLRGGKPFGFDKIIFVRRLTYSANHYYTEFINSKWTPGGNLCLLDLAGGKVTELVPELQGGVFERFDLDFDARHVVFAWKPEAQKGYRLYEIEIDPATGERKGELRQLTFPQEDEERLVELYRARPHYHHGTDDMHPCYLPDGDIGFISTRCQYGILCDAPDDFTTTVLYRMPRAGGKMTQLSKSSVSEASPAILSDGRIMYTRWEYYDKGAVSVKCLWSMKPDGSSSAEIYGNDISLPPTFLYGRPIPDMPNHYVMLGTPHCPQNGMGTVIRLDMSKNIRTREPMTYMTPYADIQAEPGFAFKDKNGNWKRDRSGRGPLFKDPYPLSDKLFLVSYKRSGAQWQDPTGYGLALLDETGAVGDIHREDDISCWLPYPLKVRTRPPALKTPRERELAARNLARCVVTDVYHGMEETERGSIKYIRVLEQIPRPWATRRRWGGDCYDQQHATITKDTHLGLKVQHGVVPVEQDGSAHFLVPARANISFQVLDENYMAVQTERTFVNYIPGETRSCIGCHEVPNDAVASAKTTTSAVMALQRDPSMPGPQLGETAGARPLDYETDVQPVFDKYCVRCHSGDEPKGGLRLSGERTALFNTSYEQLVPPRRGGLGRRNRPAFIGPTIGENHPKTGNVHYMPARSFGSHNSILAAMLAPGHVKLKDPAQAELAEKLAKKHKAVKIKPEDLLKITNWVDTNAQYYGMYWGRKNLQHKEHPNFRPKPTFERAISMTSLIPEEER